MSFSILRFANVYGPGQNPKSEAGVISIFVDSLLKGKDINVLGDGNQTRDFIYVKDVAQALIHAQNLEGIYNVSSGKEISINELVSDIFSITEKKVKTIYSDKREGDIMRSCLDNSKIIDSGWSQKFSLQQGLRETIDYMNS